MLFIYNSKACYLNIVSFSLYFDTFSLNIAQGTIHRNHPAILILSSMIWTSTGLKIDPKNGANKLIATPIEEHKNTAFADTKRINNSSMFFGGTIFIRTSRHPIKEQGVYFNFYFLNSKVWFG